MRAIQQKNQSLADIKDMIYFGDALKMIYDPERY